MTEYTGLTITRQCSVALVTIDNQADHNAMSPNFLQELKDSLSELETDNGITTIIYTGTGKSFIAGADIAYMQHMTADEAIRYSENTTDLYAQMLGSRKVLIAAVNGYALGAGTEFALACDIRLASPTARFGFPEVKLGIIPGGGGTQRLARLVGIGYAKELIFTGRIIKAEAAVQAGLVNRMVPQEELVQAAVEIANEIGLVSPVAVGYAKDCLNQSEALTIDAGICYERNMFGVCFAAPDQKEGMSAFLEKRAPVFTQKMRD